MRKNEFAKEELLWETVSIVTDAWVNMTAFCISAPIADMTNIHSITPCI